LKNQRQEHAGSVLIEKSFTKNKEKTQHNPHEGGNKKTTTTREHNTSEPQKQQPSKATLHAAENKQGRLEGGGGFPQQCFQGGKRHPQMPTPLTGEPRLYNHTPRG